MSYNNPPNSFFNNSDPDDNAETQIDGPGYPPQGQGPYPPYANNQTPPYNQPPNYGNQNPPYPPQGQGQGNYNQPPNYGQSNPNTGNYPPQGQGQGNYSQPPNYGNQNPPYPSQNPPYPPNSGYSADHSQQVTNLGGPGHQPPPYNPQQSYGPPPNYGPQGNYNQPPTQMPNAGYQNNWHEADSETRFDVSDQPQVVQPLGLLIVKRPLERRGYAHHVRGSCTIGRRAGNILLAADDLVSEYHTSIRLGDPVDGEPTFWIADMNSRNGTKVNGVKIEGRYRLQNGDEIGIGRSIFVFMMLKD